MQLVLASTSPFRQHLLERLQVPFVTFAPPVDETPYTDESPAALVKRLAQLKAKAAQATYPEALIIGSDQVAVLGDTILGKPGTHERAVAQLTQMSGKQVEVLTGLCLYNAATGHVHLDMIPFRVVFRPLTAMQIEIYLRRDTPYNCSGSLRSEGLGIALLEKMHGDDPTALIGLPLIRLVHMLETENFPVI